MLNLAQILSGLRTQENKKVVRVHMVVVPNALYAFEEVLN